MGEKIQEQSKKSSKDNSKEKLSAKVHNGTDNGSINKTKKKSKCCTLSNCLSSFLFVIVMGSAYLFVLKTVLFQQQRVPNAFYRNGSLVGHNGAGEEYPEDTLMSLDIALKEFNCDIVELDVRSTKDGKLVCIHDQHLDRTTNGTGLVSQKTLKQIKSLDAGWKWEKYRNQGITVPTIEEAAEWLKQQDPSILILIELKPPVHPTAITQILDLFTEYPFLYERAIVMSFDPMTLMKLRASNADIGTAIVIAKDMFTRGCNSLYNSGSCNTVNQLGLGGFLDWISYTTSKYVSQYIGVGGYVVHWQSISIEDIQQLKSEGIWVDLWGITSEDITKFFYDLGVSVAPNVLYPNIRK